VAALVVLAFAFGRWPRLHLGGGSFGPSDAIAAPQLLALSEGRRRRGAPLRLATR
jgi:hypothetical protein